MQEISTETKTAAAVGGDNKQAKQMPAAKKARAALPVYIILAVIIAAQLVYTVLSFAYRKDGFYGDEVWGYGLSNSYYKPFIYLQKDVPIDNATVGDLDNFNEWLDGSVFNDYITVQEGERFAYGSVFYNQSLDHHPPLYYMLLHTVCSFFPNSFSFLYGFVPNCIFLVITTLFLFKLSALMTEDAAKALVPTALYAASTGALSTFLYIRQYSLLTALLMMTVYFTAAFFYRLRREGECRLTAVIPIAVASFFTFFTHYYGIVFLGVLTAVICLWLLFRRKIKAMLVYGGSVLGALGLFFAIYPAAIRQALTASENSSETVKDMVLSFWGNFRLCLSHTLRYSMGIRISVAETDTTAYLLAALVILLMICVPVFFLFRKEKWFAALKEKAKDKGSEILQMLRHADALFIGMVLGVAVSLLLISKQVDFYYYVQTATRYVFHLMPIACAAIVFLIYKVIELIPRAKRFAVPIMSVLAAAALVRMNIMWPCRFFFKEAGNESEVRKTLAGKNCLLIIEEELPENTLSNYPSYLCKANKVYATMMPDLEDSLDDIAKEQVDCIIVHYLNYTLTEEQYGQIKTLYEKYGTEFDDGLFKHEGQERGSSKGLESERFYESFPKDDYTPVYVLNINLEDYVVLERTGGSNT